MKLVTNTCAGRRYHHGQMKNVNSIGKYLRTTLPPLLSALRGPCIPRLVNRERKRRERRACIPTKTRATSWKWTRTTLHRVEPRPFDVISACKLRADRGTGAQRVNQLRGECTTSTLRRLTIIYPKLMLVGDTPKLGKGFRFHFVSGLIIVGPAVDGLDFRLVAQRWKSIIHHSGARDGMASFS
jgi:hypothetical protein